MFTQLSSVCIFGAFKGKLQLKYFVRQAVRRREGEKEMADETLEKASDVFLSWAKEQNREFMHFNAFWVDVLFRITFAAFS